MRVYVSSKVFGSEATPSQGAQLNISAEGFELTIRPPKPITLVSIGLSANTIDILTYILFAFLISSLAILSFTDDSYFFSLESVVRRLRT